LSLLGIEQSVQAEADGCLFVRVLHVPWLSTNLLVVALCMNYSSCRQDIKVQSIVYKIVKNLKDSALPKQPTHKHTLTHTLGVLPPASVCKLQHRHRSFCSRSNLSTTIDLS
jgi:cobyrinic acid a,c-diamide synthase